MSKVQVGGTRKFKYGKEVFDDPNPGGSFKEVLEILSAVHPEFINASISDDEPELDEETGTLTFTIEAKMGKHG